MSTLKVNFIDNAGKILIDEPSSALMYIGLAETGSRYVRVIITTTPLITTHSSSSYFGRIYCPKKSVGITPYMRDHIWGRYLW